MIALITCRAVLCVPITFAFFTQPRCGGAALWAKSLLLRINRDYKALSDAAHYLAQTSEVGAVAPIRSFLLLSDS